MTNMSLFYIQWVNYCATMPANRVRFPIIPTDLPFSSVVHPSEASKWVLHNTGARSGSSTMRVAPIDHHWWYDRRLGTYNPRSVGRTRVESFNGISVQVYTVSFLVMWKQVNTKDCIFSYMLKKAFSQPDSK